MLLHLTTVVWGSWHLGVYLDANLPSLLAAGNLPALAAQHDALYRIFTTARDVPRLTSSRAFQRAQQVIRIEVIECEVEKYTDAIAAHHALWLRSTEEARDAGAMIVFIPPDVIWSNNSLAHLGALIERGKLAIFGTYVRAVSETCVPAARRLFLGKDEMTIDAPPRELVKLMLRHIHPLALTYLRDSANFPLHPELVLWSVPGEGFLARYLTREMFAYDPRLVDLNAQALPAHELDPTTTHYITDSDDLFSISLAPRIKDIEWYANTQRLDATVVANWWLTYDSPANDLTAKQAFATHVGPLRRNEWRRAELESNALIRRLIGAREILRVMKDLAKMELRGLGEILAGALAETKLAALSGSTEAMTLFIPTGGLIDASRDLLRPGNERRLVAAIRDHCVYGTVEMLPGRGDILRTATGRQRELTWLDGRHFVDGVAVREEPFRIGRNRGYLVDHVLRSTATTS